MMSGGDELPPLKVYIWQSCPPPSQSETPLKSHCLKPSLIVALAAAGAILLSQSAAALPNTSDTRMLSEPAVSARNIAFMYAGDLWLANLDGGNPRRLTSDLGDKSNPVFSPDGKQIAYSAIVDGNADVYVLPVEGGIPKRLTYHPGADLAQGFAPDGKSVLFTSPRCR
jgi:tricorn protease